MSIWVTALAAVLGVVTPETAQRGPRLVYLRDAETEQCPGPAELKSAVAARLGYDPFDDAGPTSMLVRLSKTETGLSSSIELVDEAGTPRGRRTLATTGQSCTEMATAMALTISIAIDPERALGAAPTAPSATAQPGPVPATPEEPAKRAEPEASQEPEKPPIQPRMAVLDAKPVERLGETFRVRPLPEQRSVSLTGLSMLGLAPKAAFGSAVAVQSKQGAWSIAAGLRFARSLSATVAHPSDVQALLVAAEAGGCLRHLLFEHCAIAVFGPTWVWSTRIATPRTDVGLFGAAGFRSGLALPVAKGFEAVAQLEALAVAAPIHPQVSEQDVWAAPYLVGGFQAGARLLFP